MKLDISKINGGYDKRPILFDISFSVNSGEVTTIIGPNGCGKSTLLKGLCGILPLTSGEVSFNGDNLLKLKPAELAKRISYLPQSRRVPYIRVENLVLHGRFPYLSYPRHYKAEDYEIVQKALERMNLLDKKDCRVDELSGGERQKAYVAMCLAQGTDIMLFDEPTTYFDIKHQYSFLDEAKSLATEGKCVIMVLHDLAQALENSDKIVVLDKGRVVLEGCSEEIYQSKVIESIFGVRISKAEGHYFSCRL